MRAALLEIEFRARGSVPIRSGNLWGWGSSIGDIGGQGGGAADCSPLRAARGGDAKINVRGKCSRSTC